VQAESSAVAAARIPVVTKSRRLMVGR
jgi:hypothetical protein